MAIKVTRRIVYSSLLPYAILVLFYTVGDGVLAKDDTTDVKTDAGHLQRFGEGRPVLRIDEVQGFPTSEEFIEKYVLGMRPLKMTNAAALSKALKLWTDEYFLGIDIPEHETVEVESGKKEDRKEKLQNWHFHDFIRKYNESGVYLVEDLPYYLAQDVAMPCPLQCDAIEDYLSQTILWMNSGESSSVIHTDQWHNLNCLYRGDKEFRLIDSTKYSPDIVIDVKKKGYSSADVDRVDFERFPGLATVEEYYHVNMTAGDCLYLPAKWIHQVRSHGSNVAVNVWFLQEHQYELGKCNSECDPTRTMDNYDFTSPDVALQSPEKFKQHFTKFIFKKGPQAKGQLIRSVLGSEFDDAEVMDVLLKLEKQIFAILDQNKDDSLEVDDLAATTWKGWENAHELIRAMAHMENVDDDEDVILDFDDSVFVNGDEIRHGDNLVDGDDNEDSILDGVDSDDFILDGVDKNDIIVDGDDGTIVDDVHDGRDEL